jgi:hypothetical protein
VFNGYDARGEEIIGKKIRSGGKKLGQATERLHQGGRLAWPVRRRRLTDGGEQLAE